MRVVLTGGGTGGHLIPLEPIIDALRTTFPEQRQALPAWIDRRRLELYFLGVLTDEARSFFERLAVSAIDIPAAKLRRYPSALTASDLALRLPRGLVKSFFKMWSLMPDVVVSKGGYGSVPTCLAATFYRVPFLLHESDAVSGLANRRLAPLASVITVGFAATRHEIRFYKNKTVVTGTPVRAALFRESQAVAKRHFGFAREEPVLLVMGGSQGAEQLNRVLIEALPHLLPDMGVLHLTGPAHLARVRQEVRERVGAGRSRLSAYKTYGYLTGDIGLAITAADVVVTRAGATALAELAHARKPTIVVPLARSAQDHQRQNAAVFDRAQAALVLSPENLGRSLLVQNVRTVLLDRHVRETLQRNMAELDHPRAARDIAELVFQLARGLAPVQPLENRDDGASVT